jgi:hypothetical protein
MTARCQELTDAFVQFFRRYVQRHVFNILSGLFGEQFMNDGRFAVSDWVAYDSVAISVWQGSVLRLAV